MKDVSTATDIPKVKTQDQLLYTKANQALLNGYNVARNG